MSEHLDLWNRLGQTDPKHTKPFQRAGGFRGTAIKPIYLDQKMTETFGPCGIGWGYSEPQFQLVSGGAGETAVFCWLNLWYRTEDGQISEPIPGVGGDFVVKTVKERLVTDDEAFKKAATDALGNAMKHLGMSADVHMGQFDGNKYVGRDDDAGHTNGRRTQAEISANKERKAVTLESIYQDISQLGALRELERWGRDEDIARLMATLPLAHQAHASERLEERRKELSPPEASEEAKMDYVRLCLAVIDEAK